MQHLTSKPSGTDLASQLWNAVFASFSFDNTPQNRRFEPQNDGSQNDCDSDWDFIKNKMKHVIPDMARYYRLTNTAVVEYPTISKHFNDVAEILDFLYELKHKKDLKISISIQIDNIYGKIMDARYLLERAQNSILNEKNFDKKTIRFKELLTHLDNLATEIKVKFGS